MVRDCVIVLDIGKTLAKLSLWAPSGEMIGRKTRPNARPTSPNGYPCLDVQGIEDWMAGVLAEFAQQAEIEAIVPVAHGAAVVVLEPDGGYLDPIDYETPLPDELCASYVAQRPTFGETGSPSLPGGLNFGAQLHWLEALLPKRFKRGSIVPWAQFWAWRLSDVAASEVTSLGTHTDIWRPAGGVPSSMAVRRGWAGQMAPLRRASDVLGTVTSAWRARCGLPASCKVYCGIHDSNADLLAVRSHPLIGGREHTVISTGTWFIAMRSSPERVDVSALPAGRDCLVNVNAFGSPVPSARFMGGRETEILEDANKQIDPSTCEQELLTLANRCVQDGVFALPSFQKGVGPYPDRLGCWINRPGEHLARRAAAGLYLALMMDTSLDLIGSSDRLVVEGRFMGDAVFARSLARLRPSQSIYLAPSSNSLCHGALSLVGAGRVPETSLVEVKPSPLPLGAYKARWRELLATAL